MAPRGAPYQQHHDDLETGQMVPKVQKRALPFTVTARIKEVTIDISRLKASVEELKELQSRGKEVIGQDEKQAHERRVKECTELVNRQIKDAASQIKILQDENRRVLQKVESIVKRAETSPDRSDAERQADADELETLAGKQGEKLESRRQRTDQLLKDFKNIKDQVQDLERSYQREKRQTTRAQLEDVLDEQVTDDLVDRVMNVPGALQQIVTEKMTSRGAVVLEDTMSKLQERLAFADQLEREVVLLAEMLIEMNQTLAQQGEQIQVIAQSIEGTLKDLKKTTKSLQAAVEYKGTRHKTQMWVWMAVLAVIAVIILVLIFGVVKI